MKKEKKKRVEIRLDSVKDKKLIDYLNNSTLTNASAVKQAFENHVNQENIPENVYQKLYEEEKIKNQDLLDRLFGLVDKVPTGIPKKEEIISQKEQFKPEKTIEKSEPVVEKTTEDKKGIKDNNNPLLKSIFESEEIL